MGKHKPRGTVEAAARWMAEHAVTLQTAADRFGVTQQAVNRAWRRLLIKELAFVYREGAPKRLEIVEAVVSASPTSEICTKFGIAGPFVGWVCQQVDRKPFAAHAQQRSRLLRAILLVEAGGTFRKACAIGHVSASSLRALFKLR